MHPIAKPNLTLLASSICHLLSKPPLSLSSAKLLAPCKEKIQIHSKMEALMFNNNDMRGFTYTDSSLRAPMFEGIGCDYNEIEEKLAALEQLDREHKPWQHGFQQLLNFPLSTTVEDNSVMPNQPYVAGIGTAEFDTNHNSSLPADFGAQLFEPESCITYLSEACKDHYKSSSEAQEEGISSSATMQEAPNSQSQSSQHCAKVSVTRERRKRKRAKACKNTEEVESQRMTHIAVERNRRKQMNEHLSVLRSLMPGSYIQRGDQASIIGGAIDYVKELEQLLQSLQAQKHKRDNEELGIRPNSVTPFDRFFNSPQYRKFTNKRSSACYTDETEINSAVADIEVTMIETHANIKILLYKRAGQLLRIIDALQPMLLTILHLNITTADDTILYCFNVKIEDECQMGSADEIATAVHYIIESLHTNTVN